MRQLPVYVISLADARVRRANMTARLGALGIPFQFVDAIDGRTERLPDQFDGARVDRRGFWGESALACAMSHRNVHRMIADGEEEMALVLEDDAQPTKFFPVAIERARQLYCGAFKYIRDIRFQFDGRFDVFKFEGSPHRRHVSLCRIAPDYSAVVQMTPSMGAATYLLTKDAAERFCALSVLDQMNDEAFGDPRLGLRVLEIEPYVAHQDKETATTVNLQSYGPKPAQFRRTILQRLAYSLRKRARLVSAYGPRIALALLTGNTR